MNASVSADQSVLNGTLPLVDKIKRARLELLDLSTRNRLLNTPRSGKARIIEVVNELSAAMYQTLVVDEKRFTFSPARSEESLHPEPDGLLEHDPGSDAVAAKELAQPDVELDAQGRTAAHWDGRLATRMTSAGLQKRLLDLYIDAKTLQEEQGVNILYLAIGYLRWRDANTPQMDRYAPLVLVPVVLERSNAGEKFHLRWSGDDIQSNLSLQAMLSRSHGLRLPEISDFETLNIDAYMSDVEAMISGKANWAVLQNDAVLGLFSFAKFMMYRDLDPEQWTSIGGFEAIPTVRGVVSDGFPRPDNFVDDDANVDPLIPPQDMLHVMDCDSSQSLVVHDARRGTHLLVQGPPGTGKSQTIANIISAAVADGKTVLFVAEKMAALEVVKRRLDSVGVGVACLELHSNKANKRTLLEELRRTWQLGIPRSSEGEGLIEQLTETRDELNGHAYRMHALHRPSELTPYEVLGHLVRLRRMGQSTIEIPLDGPTTWVPHQKDERLSLIRDLAQRITTMGTPSAHAWFGVGNDSLLPNDRDRLVDTIRGLKAKFDKWMQFVTTLNRQLDLQLPNHFQDIGEARIRADLLVRAPGLGPNAFVSRSWSDVSGPRTVMESVKVARQLRQKVETFASPNVLSMDWHAHEIALSELPPSFTQEQQLAHIAKIHDLLERARMDVVRLGEMLKEQAPITLDSAQRLVTMADRAPTIPDLERVALVSNIWERGIESINQLVDAVEKIQDARRSLEYVFRDVAWSTELEEARGHLAVMGNSWFRFLSGNWRRANRLIRSLSVSPGKQTRDEMLRSLDQLISARAAQNHVNQQAAQGRDAFAGSWEGERSQVPFLRSVVAWMRELRPLGAVARERLADLADRELAAEIGRRLRPILTEARQLLSPIDEALVSASAAPWGDETMVGRVPLTVLQNKVAVWKAAHEGCKSFHGPHAHAVQVLRERIDIVRQAQAALDSLRSLESAGGDAFGVLWQGIETEPQALEQAVEWITANPDLLLLASKTNNAPALLTGAEQAIAYAGQLVALLRDVFGRLHFQGNGLVPKEPEQATLKGLAGQMDRWQSNPEGLPEWVTYLARANEARRRGLGAFVAELESGLLRPSDADSTFELAYYEAILREQVAASPQLGKFDGAKHSQLVRQFADLDRRRIRHAIGQVLKAHHQKIPRSGGTAGPVGILRAEMERQRRHMPIRQLMQRCGSVVQALKPVFMMSPLSVAQFLPPTVLKFDLLVVDEASQVQPVDALGGIARVQQMVIVGDERQLPPTRFFARLLGDDSEDDERGAATADIESILGLCRARGLPERMLRWHYRSRHQSLIAVSNSQFYSNRLFIVPSPYNGEAGMGLRLHHMPDNIYDRGNTSTNPGEAQIIANAVIAHAKTSPSLSLGVAAFSTTQRRAIVDALELLRRQHPETEAFFAGRPDEPFFVKSLENIQGDERDVIFISVAYGRDAEGQFPMYFGPLSKEGGERRLNVLISRAKRRCEIFSPMTDDDIDLERAHGKGVAAFKLFLHYARTGRLSITKDAEESRHGVFEQQVAEALKQCGYNVHTKIGTAGCFVDLAVADPARPGRYILGVECDGTAYHSARSARDRDRLRTTVLEDQKWIIYRVWSSDWFHRPQAELEKLVQAVERAKVTVNEHDAPIDSQRRAAPVNFTSVERGDMVEVGLIPTDETSASTKYEEAQFRPTHTRYELHELPAGLMASVVQRVVEIEGPVHRAEVVVRVRSIWGLQRAGGRIQAAVEAGISHAILQKIVDVSDGEFLGVPGQAIQVRDRSDVASLGLRRPEYLPPSEIDAALRLTIDENLGATQEELVLCVSRKLGYRSTSQQLREIIEQRTKHLIDGGVLAWQGEHIRFPGN